MNTAFEPISSMRADDMRTDVHASAVRSMVVWCPDWPVVAAVRSGLVAADEPVGVLRANRVIAASTAARSAGVRRAMRRREAQSRCPEIVVINDDTARDARMFEQVAAVIDEFTPRIEVARPGLCQFPTRGPSRYFGGDEALAIALRLALARIGVEARIGVADGAFTAALAARQIELATEATATASDVAAGEFGPAGSPIVSHAGGCVAEVPGIVPPGESAAYLAGYPVNALVAVEGGRAVTRAAASSRRSRASRAISTDSLALIDLVELLQRLGIATLGAFAALPKASVVARFGPVGERAWRLACGLDSRPPLTRVPPPDLVVITELDPPVERVDTAAFIAKSMAEELHARLASHGLACTRVSIEAQTTDGLELARLWRHERAGAAGGLTAQNLADRVRWQIEGWLQARSLADQRAMRADGSRDVSHNGSRGGLRANDLSDLPERLTGGLTVLRLVPDEVVPDEGRQLGLWGGSSARDERASRAFARVQGLLGPDAVCTPVLVGGRRPGDAVILVPWGDERVASAASGTRSGISAEQPWPGRLPSPLPTIVYPLPLPVKVLDATGGSVRVSRRGELMSTPVSMVTESSRSRSIERGVVNWAGPWPLEEKWWDLQAARRQARMQLITDDKRAYLVVVEGGEWWIEAEYA